MKKRSIRLIIGLMSFALLGVMAMQFYFLRQSYLMQSELFDRSVNEALNTVANKVAKHDAVRFLNAKAEDKYGDTAAEGYVLKKQKVTVSHTQTVVAPAKKSLLNEYQRKVLRDSLRRLNQRRLEEELAGTDNYNFRIRFEEYTDEYGDVYGRMIPEVVKKDGKQQPQKTIKINKYDTLRVVYLDPQFGRQVVSMPRINPLWQREQERKRKEREVARIRKLLEVDSLRSLPVPQKKVDNKITVIENLAEEYRKADEPLTKRVDKFWIDSLLRFELHSRGIYLPFSYEVLTASNDSLIFSKAMDMQGTHPEFVDASNMYQTAIFGNEVINDPGKIRILFPEKNTLILGRMGASMGTTAGLLVVLIVCFGYTIFSIIRQKKVSEMKLDFINNMTHEFKTPVSTIMIASEALKDDEMTGDKSRVSRLANIIYEENLRLGSHIERVLNIARLEKDDFKLDSKPVDVNEMASLVLDSMALKLQKNNAEVITRLDAENAVIIADELHFSNVLYNLIDNAIKYSTDAPRITITTLNRNGGVVIKVADEGIGMSRDQQSKIFEQFYRIPTGNLHDVKGFGLGLSYVNTIVKKLNGAVSVKSEKDRGSEFELKFPLA